MDYFGFLGYVFSILLIVVNVNGQFAFNNQLLSTLGATPSSVQVIYPWEDDYDDQFSTQQPSGGGPVLQPIPAETTTQPPLVTTTTGVPTVVVTTKPTLPPATQPTPTNPIWPPFPVRPPTQPSPVGPPIPPALAASLCDSLRLPAARRVCNRIVRRYLDTLRQSRRLSYYLF